MLAAEDKWVSIPVCHRVVLFPRRKVTAQRIHLKGGGRGWEENFKQCLCLLAIDRNYASSERKPHAMSWGHSVAG